tara:strand:+ start:660 stop:821 length:162 start_codon:yes stop_codon:yes gene_type:complete
MMSTEKLQNVAAYSYGGSHILSESLTVVYNIVVVIRLGRRIIMSPNDVKKKPT